MNERFPALLPLVLENTLRHWDEPHRRWHGRAHLEQLLGKIEADAELTESDREMLRYVALFHDAVYAPLASDNEEQSARLASLHLALYPRRLEVITTIMATKTHRSEEPLARKFNAWNCAILRTTDWDALLDYEDGIAFEYRTVEQDVYRRERSRFLRDAAVEFHNPLLAKLAEHVAHE